MVQKSKKWPKTLIKGVLTSVKSPINCKPGGGELSHEVGYRGGAYWPTSVRNVISACVPDRFNRPSRAKILDVPAPGWGCLTISFVPGFRLFAEGPRFVPNQGFCDFSISAKSSPPHCLLLCLKESIVIVWSRGWRGREEKRKKTFRPRGETRPEEAQWTKRCLLSLLFPSPSPSTSYFSFALFLLKLILKTN